MTDPATSNDRIGLLAEEYLERHRRGLGPSVESYAEAHPDLADEIRRLFPALLMMEDLKPASGDETGSFAGDALVVRGARLERIGDFRILREVGRGGMGVVYEAEQESLGRRVALKVLAIHSLSNPAHRARFEREARAAARLHHTNIVPVFGVGEEQGLHYYVMQFIQGLGLDEVIAEVARLRPGPPQGSQAEAPCPDAVTATAIARSLISEHFELASPEDDDTPDRADGPDSPAAGASTEVARATTALSSLSHSDGRYFRSVARIGVQVARALEYSHAQGVFHRDIKPSNLLLDVQGTAWVADFGLAKAVEGDDLTHTGDIVGTLRYMAPERFRGKCDARSDVYALGLTLFEMIALRPAFQQTDRQELIRQVMEEEPPRLRKLEPAVPRDLETVVHKAIAKDPSGRYATAGAMADDLSLFLEGRPVRARRAGAAERLWKWARRRPSVAALLAGLIGAVVAGLTAVTWQWRAAVAARDEARRTLSMANDAVNTYFTQVSEEKLLKVPGMQPLRRRLLEQALPYYQSFVAQKSDDPILRSELANAYLRLGRIAADLGLNNDAESHLKGAVARFRDILQGEPANVRARIGLAEAHQELSRQRIFNGQPEAGRREAERAIAAWQEVLAVEPGYAPARPMLGRSYDLLGVGWGQVGDIKAAVPHFQKAVEIHRRVVSDAPEDREARTRLGRALSNLANAHRFNGWLAESEQGSGEAVAIIEPLSAADAANMELSRALASCRNNHGRAQFVAGAIRAAEASLSENRRLCRDLVRDNPRVPDLFSYLANTDLSLARVHMTQGRTRLATQILDEGFAAEQALLGLNPRHEEGRRTLAEYHSTRARLEADRGEARSASRPIEEAIRLQAEMHRRRPDHPEFLNALFESLVASLPINIEAGRETSVGRLAEIDRILQELLRQRRDDPKNTWAASQAVSGYRALAEHALASGAPPEALALLDRAEAVLRSGANTSTNLLVFRAHEVRLRTLRGEALRRIDRADEADSEARRAVADAEKLAAADPPYVLDVAYARALRARLDPTSPAPHAAVEALQTAVEQGFDNVYALEHDDRLAPLRPRDDFRALVGHAKERAKAASAGGR